ncbi:MAG TPA: hypothetical protein VFR84_12310 [Candidatus Angelobacter sp.]|nr:hypothetical protein [Candidatus Angelobacter sp.]
MTYESVPCLHTPLRADCRQQFTPEKAQMYAISEIEDCASQFSFLAILAMLAIHFTRSRFLPPPVSISAPASLLRLSRPAAGYARNGAHHFHNSPQSPGHP